MVVTSLRGEIICKVLRGSFGNKKHYISTAYYYYNRSTTVTPNNEYFALQNRNKNMMNSNGFIRKPNYPLSRCTF